jgi:ABC-type polysaccharide/polyol phosphate export permease
MATLIDCYRRIVLFRQPPNWQYLALAALISCLLTAAAYRYFKRVEKNFADLI